MRTKPLVVIGTLLLVGPGLLGFSPASAGEESRIDRVAIAASLEELGVDSSTQTYLLDQLEAGRLWDSLSGASPVSIETEEMEGYRYEMRIFEDGSRTQSVTEIPRVVSGMGTASTQACTTPDGPYPYGWTFANCRVDLNVALIRMNYYIDGRTRGNTATYPPKVTRAINLDYQIFGGTFVSETLDRPRPTGTTTLNAQARGRVVLNYPAQGGIVTISLYANVGSIITATSS